MGQFSPFNFLIDLANFKIQNLGILRFLIKNMAIIDTTGLEPFADLLKEIYGDLAKPGVAQVGIALATVIGLLNTCLSPIKFLNEKTELNRQNNLKLLAKRFSDIPPENIVEAPPEIAVPIAEKLVYVSNEELRNMYIELMAKACTSNLNDKAHPSFVNIINNLSPDEAIFLKALHQIGTIRISSIHHFSMYKSESFVKYFKHEAEKKYLEELSFPQNIAAYIENFEGLGIVSVSIDNSSELEMIKKIERYIQDTHFDQKTKRFNLSSYATRYKWTLKISPYGKLFLEAISTETHFEST